MSALGDARVYLAKQAASGVQATMHAGHPDVLLAELVAEIEGAPVVPVTTQVGPFTKPLHEVDWSDAGFQTTYARMLPCNEDGSDMRLVGVE